MTDDWFALLAEWQIAEEEKKRALSDLNVLLACAKCDEIKARMRTFVEAGKAFD